MQDSSPIAPRTGQDVALPASLRKQLQTFESHLCRIETMAAVSGGISGTLLSCGILFFVDRFWDTPAVVRLALVTAAAAALAAFAAVWCRHWLLRRRSLPELATLIQRRHRALGDRLQGIIELAQGPLPGQSPALSRAAIRQVAAEAASMNFDEAVPRREYRLLSRVLIVLFVLAAVPFLVVRDAAVNTIERWLQPFAGPARYTFARLETLPRRIVVPHGEAFKVVWKLSPDAFWRPRGAVARLGAQPAVRAARAGDAYALDLPGQVEPDPLRLRAGDTRDRINIVPMYRPILSSLRADIEYPAYLRRPPSTMPVANGRIEALPQSRLRLSGHVNRPLASATLTTDKTTALSVTGAEFRTETFLASSYDEVALSWRDELGLDPAQPQKIQILKVTDEAPFVDARDAAASVAVLEDDVVAYDLYSLDDYGVRELGVRWTVAAHTDAERAGAGKTLTLTNGAPDLKSLAARYVFSPVAERVTAGATVELFAEARDYYPDRPASRSTKYTIRVLSWEQHAQLIQKAMDELQNNLEQLVRAVDDTHASTRELGKQSPEELRKPEAASKLAEQRDEEKAHRDRLSKLSESVKDTIAKAMRNKKISEKTLMAMAEAGMDMKDIADGSMEEAEQAMDQASKDAESRPQGLQKATKKQDKAMEELQRLQKKLNQNVERMLAQTFVNRLHMSAEAERDISTSLKDHLQETVGLPPESLDEEQRTMYTRQAEAQVVNRTKVGHIEDDLAGFFNRTRQPIYQEVFSNMVAKAVQNNLQAIARMIEDNLALKGISNAEKWATELDAWAAQLDRQSQQDDSGDSNANSGKSLEQRDMQIILALERARQHEESIREQTRKLDETRDASRRYRSDANKLGKRQGELALDMSALERLASNNDLSRLIEKAGGEMMNSDVMLRKPQTDAETIAVQTEIIELLSASLSSARKSAPKSGSMQGMAGMLGMSLQGGGNPMQNASNAAGSVAPDGTQGRGQDDRQIDKSGGRAMSGVAPEFKDAMEGFFNAIDTLR